MRSLSGMQYLGAESPPGGAAAARLPKRTALPLGLANTAVILREYVERGGLGPDRKRKTTCVDQNFVQRNFHGNPTGAISRQ